MNASDNDGIPEFLDRRQKKFGAYDRGRELGDRVTFGRPVSRKGAVLQIGKR
jgi:hypothetical protein